MDYDDDPLDLLGDDGDGVIEMCLIEEEEKPRKAGGNGNNSGCCVVFLLVSSPALLTIWGIIKLFA